MEDGATTIFATGRYFDHVIASAGALKFRERIAIIDSRRIDTLLVFPI